MNNRLDNENNVAGNAYCHLEEYANGLVLHDNLPNYITNPYIDSAEKLLDNDAISDETCAEKIIVLLDNLQREVDEYQQVVTEKDYKNGIYGD